MDAGLLERPAALVPAPIAEWYERSRKRPSDFYLHVPRIADLVVELDAKTVIELGTRSGVSTSGWLYGLAQTGGHLWSVDLLPKPKFGDVDGWTFIEGSDLDPAVLRQLPPVADIVFIDTSHRYDHTLAELNVYYPRVRPGGKIVLHDTENRRPLDAARWPDWPVKTAVEEFCAEELLTWRNYPDCWGLGVIDCD